MGGGRFQTRRGGRYKIGNAGNAGELIEAIN